jgi:outer membrane lipoprotein-sorting protein
MTGKWILSGGWALWAGVAILGLAISARAEGPATMPAATQPSSAPATTQPATTSAPAAVAADPKVDAILDRLEKEGKDIKDLTANVNQELYQIIPDDRQTKRGVVRYRAARNGQDPKFMIYFDTLIHDDLKLNQKEWFCFDGKWFREIREQTKGAIDREVVADGEKFDAFKLGEGPFPLPFGQKKSEILKEFDVTLAARAKDDPADTDHLVMVPKKNGKFVKKYKKLEFWVERKDSLPVRVVSHDTHSNIITANFSEIKINTGIADRELWIDVPGDYSYTKEKL